MAETDTLRLYRPAIWLLQWCKRAGVPSPANPLVAIATTMFLGISFLWVELDPGWFSGILVAIAIVLEVITAYINYAAVIETRAEAQRVWDQIRQLNKNATGNLAQILDCFSRRHREPDEECQTHPDAYKQELRSFQQYLLLHATDVITASVESPIAPGTLSANWSLRGTGEHKDEFQVALYDRNMDDRRPQSGWKAIADGRPGASVAFNQAKVSLVPDTHGEEWKEYFPQPPAYRSILSIPVYSHNRVIGVMNIDAKKLNLLKIEHEYLVMDIGYLVGLCEVMRDE